jgi:hypothetical protein
MFLLAYYGFLVFLPVAVMFFYAQILHAQGFAGPAQTLTITAFCAVPLSVAAGFVGFWVLGLFFPHYPDEVFGGIKEFFLAVFVVVPLSCWVFLAVGWFIAANDD